jgi:hypothetical protein
LSLFNVIIVNVFIWFMRSNQTRFTKSQITKYPTLYKTVFHFFSIQLVLSVMVLPKVITLAAPTAVCHNFERMLFKRKLSFNNEDYFPSKYPLGILKNLTMSVCCVFSHKDLNCDSFVHSKLKLWKSSVRLFYFVAFAIWMIIKLMDQISAGHDQLLEICLLKKSARHNFIIAQQHSSNNHFSCQLVKSS